MNTMPHVTKKCSTGRILLVTTAFLLAAVQPVWPQNEKENIGSLLESYFSNYDAPNFQPNTNPHLVNYELDPNSNTLTVESDATFASQPLTHRIVKSIYESLHRYLPEKYRGCNLVIICNGKELADHIPNPYREKADKSRMWGKTDYQGAPWVANMSKAYYPTLGLQNRHLSVCASHGIYYRNEKNDWHWQRPYLFCTNEDLLTQTIVVPFLIPMLQNAGAVVYSPRERDWQDKEIIIDNDFPDTGGIYEEKQSDISWKKSDQPGFANPKKIYVDSENPFIMGSARNVQATSRASDTNEAAWIPDIKESGDYAVYVSYQSLPDAISNAHYIVYHGGIATDFYVNQKMGGGTWVYLGTFRFSEGQSRKNCVVLTNKSQEKGTVSADAVRFGGGMGNIARGFDEETGELFASGFPRYLEGARYSAQWAGMPYDVYADYGGENDYKDDINTRSYATNYLAGKSVFLPSVRGVGVPIELCLAVHSDAGYKENGLVGTLGICTTYGMNSEASYPAGISREASNDFAQLLVDNISTELSAIYGVKWPRREVYNRMYSESCRPDIPSAIIETLSHQNFHDMVYAHNPKFKFNIARSIYKTILKYIAFEHGKKYVVTPLTPDNLSIEFVGKDEISLRWDAVQDSLEPTAKPSGYIVYSRVEDEDFDNGVLIKGKTSYRRKLSPGTVYSFRVTAVNKGGESFPSETLSACRAATSNRPVLLVNCFNRLAGPAVINNEDSLSFDLDKDIGVPYIQTPEYSGKQQISNPNKGGDSSPSGLGFSGNELERTMIAGNTFDYTAIHGKGLAQEYSFVSCSRKAVESGRVNLSKYPMVDLIFGLEKYDSGNLEHYKTFTPRLRSLVEKYLSGGGRILASGAYIGSDMTSNSDKRFMGETLHCSYAGTDASASNSSVHGMNRAFSLYRAPNPKHYAATHVDRLAPLSGAQTIFRYSDGTPAGAAFRSAKSRAVVLGFPIECIEQETELNKIMLNIANYLISE